MWSAQRIPMSINFSFLHRDYYIVLGKSTSYEAPHYAVFYNLSSLHLSLAQIFYSACSSKTPSVYVSPLILETRFHTYTEPHARL
jgi:hypothetical protein